MLSVFITPCTKPTRIHPTTMRAVRSHTSASQRARRSARRRRGEVRVVAGDGEVDEAGEQRVVAARRRQLEVAEADERRRHAAHHGAGSGRARPS
jgi:hypothetical protein